MTEAWPTEAAATAAVDAAARKAYEAHRADVEKRYADERVTLPSYDDLSTLEKLNARESVLPLVWAALEALPDPRYLAWERGNLKGREYDTHDCPEEGECGWCVNPFPSGL